MEIKQRQIVIKPINRPQFSGINAHARTVLAIDGAQLDKTGSYKTGLTVEEEAEYEVALNLPKGTLNKKNAAFWGNLPVRLFKDKTTYFDIVSPMDELKFKSLIARSTIANNELEKNKNPFAEFYIEDAEAKAKVEEIAINFQFEAIEAFSHMTTDERKGYLKLYGKKGVDSLTDIIVKTELYKELMANPKKFLDLINDPDIKLRISIEEMLEAGSLKKKGNYYTFENETLGTSIESVIAYFKDIKNQSLKISIENEVKKTKDKKDKK